MIDVAPKGPFLIKEVLQVAADDAATILFRGIRLAYHIIRSLKFRVECLIIPRVRNDKLEQGITRVRY